MSRRRRSRALSPHAPASPPPPAAGRGRASRRVLAALALVVALAYANSFRAGFTLDNRPQILEDARIRAVDAGNLRAIFTEDYWWPVTVTSSASFGLRARSKIVLNVGMATPRRMRAGTSVHVISRRVLPCTCTGSGRSSRWR